MLFVLFCHPSFIHFLWTELLLPLRKLTPFFQSLSMCLWGCLPPIPLFRPEQNENSTQLATVTILGTGIWSNWCHLEWLSWESTTFLVYLNLAGCKQGVAFHLLAATLPPSEAWERSQHRSESQDMEIKLNPDGIHWGTASTLLSEANPAPRHFNYMSQYFPLWLLIIV